MSSAPLLVSLQNQILLNRLTGELTAQGISFEAVTDGQDLLRAITGPTDVLVDPRTAPGGLDPAAFIASIASRARGGRVLAQCSDAVETDSLVDLGASDVFGDQDSARLIVRRLGQSQPVAMDLDPNSRAGLAVKSLESASAAAEVAAPSAPEPAASEGPVQASVEAPAAPLPAAVVEVAAPSMEATVSNRDALGGFTERVATRLTRARDRERTVAVFCASVRGLANPDDKEQIQSTLEKVLDELDTTQQMSYSASRIAIAPIGEDLFAILVPDIERVQDAARLAVRFHEAIAQEPGVIAHVGISCSPDDGTVASDLIQRSCEAVRRARQAGENHVEFYSSSMSRWAFERLTLEQSLRDALRNRELVVYYQPRIDIETRRILGMEALVRWIHPQFGLVSPGQFIPLAEETGLIVPIGEWILRDACRQNAAWRQMGLPNIRVSVNLSPIQFRKSDLHETVYSALDEAGLDADGLELEVTESLLMNDPAETATILGKLKARGIHISIDDFGTGYSSLSYLKRFPINALKIDRSFVTDVTSNPDDAAIATAIILMGHSLKLQVVAEGVETENQLQFLRVLQCNEVQGYLFSPPVPAERAQEMLANRQFELKADNQAA